MTMPYKSHEELIKLLALDRNPNSAFPVLDLACGSGRSGLMLSQTGVPVVFADRSSSALDGIRKRLSADDLPGQVWQVDLEQQGINPFANKVFSAAICFRYLHRPLFPHLRDVVESGGLVIYETFTTENRRFGRPANPEFLLEPEELRMLFQGWEVIHHYEGIQHDPDRAIAQIVCRKPKLDN